MVVWKNVIESVGKTERIRVKSDSVNARDINIVLPTTV